MENKNSHSTQSELIDSLILKCWEDETFKQKLKQSPRATIEEFLGRPAKLPEDSQFVINDQEETSEYYINIPPKPDLNVELMDNELEQIAGGRETNNNCDVNNSCVNECCDAL